MRVICESLFLSILGTVPSLVIVAVLFHNPSCAFPGFSLLVAFAVLCACVALLMAHYRLLASRPEGQPQNKDPEYGGSVCDRNTTDAPPNYDAVMATPPPYDHLCTTADEAYVSVTDILPCQDEDAKVTLSTEENLDKEPPSYTDISKTTPA
ncbi:uncharacterized protein LOC121876265 [Homarus americanus]|uniref:Uncharacterized protein n=1 Tax=Homarus americanus TaxID=6706 RepID=A0A8J5JQD5_HOMAM|nr:uncharacterized protein LOC121876265 [Homarus americanus]KAG7160406.1 hypothetical protein Hamer_G001646 [Homarus americanus]